MSTVSDPTKFIKALQTINEYENPPWKRAVNRAQKRAAIKNGITKKEYDAAISYMTKMNKKFDIPEQEAPDA